VGRCSVGFRWSAIPLACAVPAMATTRLPILIWLIVIPVGVMVTAIVYG
jgi:hypothetical protein